MSKQQSSGPATPRELVISRRLSAPRTLVWRTWTDPEHLAAWWGPAGFTNPRCEVDVRPGGAIRIDMRGPDGVVYPMTGEFRELVEPERLVFTAAALDAHGRPLLEVLNTVTFEARGDETTLTLRAQVTSVTPDGAPHVAGMETGWSQSLDRLASHVGLPAVTVADREIAVTRLLDAPRELVWRVYTDPAHLLNWWGPRGFTLTTHRMDVRPGGQWRFVMHGPDGRDYENLVTYLEVVKPERLVYKHGGDQDCEPVNFQVTATFERSGDAGHQTRLTMRMRFPSNNARDFVIREYGALEGARQTLTRLGEYLAEQAGGATIDGAPFTVSRVVRAPRDLVYKVWTERAHLERWFGPTGCTMPECTLDLRPGGVFHYAMRMASGMVLWGRWVFGEVTPPERLVFVSSFSDAEGRVARSPFSDAWPLETLSIVTFDVHSGIGGGTLVTVRGTPLGATDDERRTFEDGRASMQQGWGGTFDRMEEHLQGVD